MGNAQACNREPGHCYHFTPSCPTFPSRRTAEEPEENEAHLQTQPASTKTSHFSLRIALSSFPILSACNLTRTPGRPGSVHILAPKEVASVQAVLQVLDPLPAHTAQLRA